VGLGMVKREMKKEERKKEKTRGHRLAMSIARTMACYAGDGVPSLLPGFLF